MKKNGRKIAQASPNRKYSLILLACYYQFGCATLNSSAKICYLNKCRCTINEVWLTFTVSCIHVSGPSLFLVWFVYRKQFHFENIMIGSRSTRSKPFTLHTRINVLNFVYWIYVSFYTTYSDVSYFTIYFVSVLLFIRDGSTFKYSNITNIRIQWQWYGNAQDAHKINKWILNSIAIFIIEIDFFYFCIFRCWYNHQLNEYLKIRFFFSLNFTKFV